MWEPIHTGKSPSDIIPGTKEQFILEEIVFILDMVTHISINQEAT